MTLTLRDPFVQNPLVVSLNTISNLQQLGNPYVLPTGVRLSNQIAQAIANAKQASLPPLTPHVASTTVSQGSAAITALMASFSSQYQYSINGQFDGTYEALAQTVPGAFTSLVKDARTAEVQQLATIAASGADAPTQAGQTAVAKVGFITGAAFELQNGVNTPVTTPPKGSSTQASGPPDPLVSAGALNDLVTELSSAVQAYTSSGNTLTPEQDASFLQGAQGAVGTLHSVALALVQQLASDKTPQYFNGSLYSATQTLTSIEATLQGLTGAGTDFSAPADAAPADLGNNLNTTA